MTQYEQWISEYVSRFNGKVLGRCKEATAEMAAAFPELKRVPGHVEVMGWGRQAHWWLVTPDGSIVDPTAVQFPLVVDYEEFTPGTPVRVGRCMNCGDDILDYPKSLLDEPRHRTFCGDACSEAMARDVGWT